MNTKSLIWGFLLVAVGALLLADNFGYLYFDWYQIWQYWPLLLIGGGVLFWLGWLNNRKEHGLLMPGTILIVYGVLFWYNMNTNWWYMEDLWPFFMIVPGLGFLAMYLFGPRDKGLLVPAAILIGLGVIFLGEWYHFRLIWPLILIAIGVRLLFKYRNQEN